MIHKKAIRFFLKTVAYSAIFFTNFFLAACGNTGPLYLPDHPGIQKEFQSREAENQNQTETSPTTSILVTPNSTTE